jgi:hypothetical protein
MSIQKTPLCPSSRPEYKDSLIFGVIGGSPENPEVNYLQDLQPITKKVVEQISPVTPAEVFRTASPCATNGCQHFDGTECNLATRIAEQLPIVTPQLPSCAIRDTCKWWQQEGNNVCFRCPQVITDNYDPSGLMREVSTLTFP